MPPKKRTSAASEKDGKPSKRKHSTDDEDNSDSEPNEKIPAIDFIEFIRDLHTYGKEKLSKLRGAKPDIAKLAESIPLLHKYKAFYTQDHFNTDFNALYQTASRRKNATMNTVVTVIDNFLNDGATVEKFPGFPKAPVRPINLYVAEHRSAGKPPTLQELAELRKTFASGTIDTEPYHTQYADESKKYTKELKKYLEENNERLGEAHIDHINAMILRLQKSSNGPTAVKKPKKEKKTAFDFFKDANGDLYTDCDEEKRNRKLQRKYDKLEEEAKRIYENIASKN